MLKPGYQTSEFWVTIAATVVSLLKVYGVVGEEDGAAWLALVEAIIPAILAAVYVWSRTRLKSLDIPQ